MTTLLKVRAPLTSFIRYAGHAKWQNIKSTKQANDLLKCKMISRYVQLVKKAIVTEKMQTDPKLNPRLAAVLAEAMKSNVPKATLERAIDRARNMTYYDVNVEMKGPGGSSIVVRCETENTSNLRREIKKVAKKFDAHIAQDNSLINMFKSQGFIRTSLKTNDGRDVNQDFAEEAAIYGGASEVELETDFVNSDGRVVEAWKFMTDAEALQPCRGVLEKQGLKVLSTDLELVPYRSVDFGEETADKVQQLELALKELEQVVEVFHNVAMPQE